MSNFISDYYGEEENCYKDLSWARRGAGTTATTPEQWERIEKTLALMYLYCPEELQETVMAQLEETQFRRAAVSIAQTADALDKV